MAQERTSGDLPSLPGVTFGEAKQLFMVPWHSEEAQTSWRVLMNLALNGHGISLLYLLLLELPVVGG